MRALWLSPDSGPAPECHLRMSAAVSLASGLLPRVGRIRRSSKPRYSARVRGLRSRSASHGLAYAASVKLDGLAFSGPRFHLPFLILVCCSARNALASPRVSNVVGAVWRLPSGPM
jgi:hypothetical protein